MNPESRDSGFDASHRPGMTIPLFFSFYLPFILEPWRRHEFAASFTALLEPSLQGHPMRHFTLASLLPLPTCGRLRREVDALFARRVRAYRPHLWYSIRGESPSPQPSPREERGEGEEPTLCSRRPLPPRSPRAWPAPDGSA